LRAQQTALDRRSLGVSGPVAPRGGDLFERRVEILLRFERARESQMRGGEARTQLQSLPVKLDGSLRVSLLARLFGPLKRQLGLVRHLREHDAQRAALRRKQRERALREADGAHAQSVATGRELELKFAARVGRAAPHFVNPDGGCGLRADADGARGRSRTRSARRSLSRAASASPGARARRCARVRRLTRRGAACAASLRPRDADAGREDAKRQRGRAQSHRKPARGPVLSFVGEPMLWPAGGSALPLVECFPLH
jgi:hypothetical protein